MTVIADTGVVYALFDRADAWHQRSVAWVQSQAMHLAVPATILGEVAHFLERIQGEDQARVFADWLLQPNVEVLPVLPQDLRRITLLASKYPALGFVDASVVAAAERLLVDTIATTDRRHFAAVRPSHVERFTLVP